jgi:hypothetical protein
MLKIGGTKETVPVACSCHEKVLNIGNSLQNSLPSHTNHAIERCFSEITFMQLQNTISKAIVVSVPAKPKET